MQTAAMEFIDEKSTDRVRQFVTVRIDQQMFGIPVDIVQDVLRGQKVTPIPLAPQEVKGLMNLRGRIVTAFDVRTRLGLPPAPEGARTMNVVVECGGEFYSLTVDSVGEVLDLEESRIEHAPANLEQRWKDVSSGVSRLKQELLIILDIDALLNV